MRLNDINIDGGRPSMLMLVRRRETKARRDDDDDGMMMMMFIGERLKLERDTENMGVCTKEWERHDSRGTHGQSLH